MDIRNKIIKIASNILADINFGTQKEFEEYIKNHPNYREDTKFFVDGMQVSAPPREKNNDSSEMTDEQKKLHEMIKHPKSFDDFLIVSENEEVHPTTLDILANKAERALKQDDISDQTYKKTFMVLERISKNPNASDKTLRRIVNSSHAYDKVDTYSSYSRKDSLIGNVVGHPNVSEDTIYDFYEDYPLRAASNPNCPTDVLEKLSSNEGDYVRFYVFENPNTKKQTREKLSKDKKVIEIYKAEMAQRPSLRL